MHFPSTSHPRRELRFHPLDEQGSGYAFPCDANGQVDLDALSDSARNDYLYARAVMGRAFRYPRVESVEA